MRFQPTTAVRRWLSPFPDSLWPVDVSGSPQVTVAPLDPDETEQAGAVLARAFRTENFTTAAFGGYDERIESAFGSFMARRMDGYLTHAQPLFVARDGETVVGMVILVRPSFSLPTRETARVLLGDVPTTVQLFRSADPRQTARVLDLHEPPEGVTDTHYDLKYIAVDPRRQDEGIGGALLRAVNDLVDRDPGASGSYLVTANESNREIYERYGYETVETRTDSDVEMDDGPIRAYHMARPTRQVSTTGR